MEEIWKDIEGYEKIYQVSNLGRIKRKSRIIKCKNNRIFQVNEKIMKPFDNGKGYLVITLMTNKRKNEYVHRLVAKCFLTNYNEKKVVNHLDFNKKNNCVSNLECISQKENIYYSIQNGRYKEGIKESSYKRIINAKEKAKKNKEKIISLYLNGISKVNIAKTLHLKTENVSEIIDNNIKKYILCVETNEKFKNIKEANKKYKVSTIKDAIAGRQKTAAKYHWKKIYERVKI